MADEPRRIIDLTETQLVGSGDYLALDSADGGTKKVKASYFSGGSENYMWGGIQGDIADQTDLYGYLGQLPNKANIDGYYDEMSVGSAEQLLSNIYEPDSDPYLFRPTAGSREVGDRVYEDAIVGGSVAWNQLIPTASKDYTNTQTDTRTSLMIQISSISSPIQDYYVKTLNNTGRLNAIFKPSTVSEGLKIKHNGLTRDLVMYNSATASLLANHTYLFIADCDGINPTVENGIDVKNIQIFDLTLMLGSTIADYVYTLEQSEAGSGIAWLKSQGYFTKDYYAYNAGGIQPVKTSAKKVVGFNQFDEIWESGTINATTGQEESSTSHHRSTHKIKVVNAQYYLKSGGATGIRCFNANDEYLGNISKAGTTGFLFTPLSGTSYIRFVIPNSYVTDSTCLNIHWDGERDGEYEAYSEHVYPLDSDLELRGIPTLVDSKIKYDGDTYASDGTVTRRYGIVDLGSESITWTKNATYQSNWRFTASLSGVKRASDATSIPNIVCSKYLANSPQATYLGYTGISVNNSSDSIEVCDLNYSDAATFKTAMSGVYLVYELATPTTESADPYTNPQLVSNWGTEEFVDTRDVPVPVGHDSRYLPDLKAKLESAPNNPSTDGIYNLQYENGEATYVPVVAELPEAPSEDGTYVLKATVSSGTATLSWVAEE